jgi:4-hydroxybenzoate polyprenyltransferase
VEFARFTRAHEWHGGKLPLLLGLVLALEFSQPERLHFTLFIGYYGVVTLFLACAYMLNNVSDLNQDRQAKKVLALESWSSGLKLFVALAVGLVGVLLGALVFPASAVACLAGCYLLAWIYSFPPRLKESYVFGPLVATVGQFVAPAAVVLIAWGEIDAAATAYVAVLFLYGLRMILVHQIIDLENDTRTGTRTTATELGRPAAIRLLRVAFFLEVLASALLLATVVWNGLSPVLLLALLIPLASLLVRIAWGEPLRLDTYAYIPLADLHESLLPLLLAAGLALKTGGVLWWPFPLLLVLFWKRHFIRLLPPWYMLRGLWHGRNEPIP